jgi:hypothetical protein
MSRTLACCCSSGDVARVVFRGNGPGLAVRLAVDKSVMGIVTIGDGPFCSRAGARRPWFAAAPDAVPAAGMVGQGGVFRPLHQVTPLCV